MVIKSSNGKIATALKEIEESVIAPTGAKGKLDRVVEGVLPDKGCKSLMES